MNFSIKELENFSGIKAHTIRTWEQRFGFLQPQRSSKLRRTYTIDELELVLDVSFLNRNGFKVSKIARLSNEEINQVVVGLSEVHHKQEKAIHELIVRMAMMDIQGFELLLETCVASWGIADVIAKIIIPFTHKAGLMNNFADKIYKPNLLMIEQSLKQKIITGIEKTTAGNTAQTVLFFLNKRSCELELLYMQYRLKNEGYHVIYISGAITTADLVTISAVVLPVFVVTSLAEKNNSINPFDFLAYLAKELPATPLLNLGHVQLLERKKAGDNFKQTASLEDLLAIIHKQEVMA